MCILGQMLCYQHSTCVMFAKPWDAMFSIPVQEVAPVRVLINISEVCGNDACPVTRILVAFVYLVQY